MNEKQEIIQKILKNPVYMPDSGLYKNLEHDLTKLSQTALRNLLMIIQLKFIRD